MYTMMKTVVCCHAAILVLFPSLAFPRTVTPRHPSPLVFPDLEEVTRIYPTITTTTEPPPPNSESQSDGRHLPSTNPQRDPSDTKALNKYSTPLYVSPRSQLIPNNTLLADTGKRTFAKNVSNTRHDFLSLKNSKTYSKLDLTKSTPLIKQTKSENKAQARSLHYPDKIFSPESVKTISNFSFNQENSTQTSLSNFSATEHDLPDKEIRLNAVNDTASSIPSDTESHALIFQPQPEHSIPVVNSTSSVESTYYNVLFGINSYTPSSTPIYDEQERFRRPVGQGYSIPFHSDDKPSTESNVIDSKVPIRFSSDTHPSFVENGYFEFPDQIENPTVATAERTVSVNTTGANLQLNTSCDSLSSMTSSTESIYFSFPSELEFAAPFETSDDSTELNVTDSQTKSHIFSDLVTSIPTYTEDHYFDNYSQQVDPSEKYATEDTVTDDQFLVDTINGSIDSTRLILTEPLFDHYLLAYFDGSFSSKLLSSTVSSPTGTDSNIYFEPEETTTENTEQEEIDKLIPDIPLLDCSKENEKRVDDECREIA